MGNTSSYAEIISTEVLSLIICLILLAGSSLENRKKSKRTQWFNLLILTDIAGCFSDAVSWILDGRPECNVILIITTLISMIMTMMAAGVFFSYFYAYLSENNKISNVPVVIGWVTVAVGIAATVVSSAAGRLFTFQNGCYAEGDLYQVYVIANMGYMVIEVVIITAYGKLLTAYEKLAAYSYMMIPMLVAAAGLFWEKCEYTYPAITVSLLILYIIIQSDRMKRLEKEGIIASYQATHDGLTGLLNRSAYQDCLEAMKKEKEEKSGIIFGDVNGLKYVNDTLGHEAGDLLLIRYKDLLTGFFSEKEIYRLSGDEFLCIVENTSEETFWRRVSELKKALDRETPPLACIGAAFGFSSEADNLVEKAENEMYEEKKIVHARYPQTRRS